MIRAILKAQLLSMRPGKRGVLLPVAVAVVWYGMWLLLSFLAAGFAADPGRSAFVVEWLPAGLLLMLLYWQLAPVATASLGASLDLRRLMVYPIPHSRLFLIEVLLRATACFEMPLMLAGAAFGLMSNPVLRSWRVLPALAGFAAFNLLVSAGMRSLLERLLARRHVRELLVFLVVCATALPRFLMYTGSHGAHLRRYLPVTEGLLWPWAAAARAATGPESAAGALILCAWIAAAVLFGRSQFERGLRFDFAAAQALAGRGREARARRAAVYRLPGRLLPDPLACIVEKELRSLSRTPRFRTVFVMGFTFGLLVWLPMAFGAGAGRQTFLGRNFLVLVSLYALALLGQVSYWNSFGFDRTAVQAWFSLPVPLATVLAAKNIAAALMILVEVSAVTATCLLARVRIPAAEIGEAFVVAPIASLYFLAVGNLSSVRYPRAMSPERLSQGGAAGRMQALLFLIYPVALFPVALAYAARALLSSELAFWGLLGFAAVLGGVFYWIALDSAVEYTARRRDQFLAALCEGEGPVITQ